MAVHKWVDLLATYWATPSRLEDGYLFGQQVQIFSLNNASGFQMKSDKKIRFFCSQEPFSFTLSETTINFRGYSLKAAVTLQCCSAAVLINKIINRPNVAGAVLQTLL